MTNFSWLAWVGEKLAIAESLYVGECGGTYAEASLLTCSTISALATELWPGERIDWKRYTQLLATLCPSELKLCRVSVPLLTEHLKDIKRPNDEQIIKTRLLPISSSAVLTGDDVDKSEQEILAVCPALPLKEIRACSYAGLVYREWRCSYVHAYKPGRHAKPWSMLVDPESFVSYVNWVEGPNQPPERHIHLHLHWLFRVAKEAAAAVDQASQKNLVPLAQPTTWWIEG